MQSLTSEGQIVEFHRMAKEWFAEESKKSDLRATDSGKCFVGRREL
jgi:hypothetical protein